MESDRVSSIDRVSCIQKCDAYKIEKFVSRELSKQTKRSNHSLQHDDIGVSFGPKELILQVLLLLLLLLLSFHCVDCECVRRESTGINRGRENQQA